MRMLLRIAVCLYAVAVVGQTPQRLSWQQFAKDPARVQSFRNAVAAMKANNSADPASAAYRMSWEYWGSMHGYFGASSKAGTVAAFRTRRGIADPQFDPSFVGVRDTTPPDDIAKAVWDQCQHGTDWFFAWHRLYLFYFEKVLQKAANDPSLRLPYWDYTDVANLGMPDEFRSPTYMNAQGQSVANPLFEDRRAPGWAPPGTHALEESDTDINDALDNANFFDQIGADGKLIPGYQRTIERGVHGNVHCDVMRCPVTVMGAVPFSANDPIFWMHHCNIDRMWDCWLSIAGHKNPSTSAFLDQPFSFVDTSGNLVTKKVRNLFDASLIDYVYEQSANCGRAATPVVQAVQPVVAATAKTARAVKSALKQPIVIGETKGVTIDSVVSKKLVSLPATASPNHPRQFALRAEPNVPVTTELILRDVRYVQHPRMRFRIYLERTDNGQRARVGTLSFFDDTTDAAHAAHAAHAAASDTRVFDATHALRALGLEGTGTLNVLVVFEGVDEPGPDFEPATAGLTVGEIDLTVKNDV